jgi:hypothetical protein
MRRVIGELKSVVSIVIAEMSGRPLKTLNSAVRSNFRPRLSVYSMTASGLDGLCFFGVLSICAIFSFFFGVSVYGTTIDN